MKSKKKILIGVCILLVVLIASIGSYYFLIIDKNKNEIPTSKAIVDPALYQACDEDSCIYLLGTIHIGDSRLLGLTDKIWNAYNNSDAIAFELDITTIPADAGEELIYLPEGDDLANYLTEEQFHKLEEFCTKRFLPIELLRTFNLAGIYSLLEQLAYLELGFLPNNGVDKQLLDKAHEDNKEIIELETYEFQSNLLYAFKDEYYIKQIESTLDNYSASKGSVVLLYNTYLTGNSWLFKSLFGDSESADELEEEYNQKMLIDRNIHMADKAEVFLKENKKVMVAVGAAHVVGKDGLIDLLRERGYQVSLVK